MIEKTVLAYCVAYPAKINEVLSKVGVTDFHDETNRAVFESIKSYISSCGLPDAAELMINIVKDGAAESGLLSELRELSPSRHNLDSYISLLEQESARNKLWALAGDIVGQADESSDPRNIIEHINEVVYQINNRIGFQRELTLLPELLDDFLANAERELAEPGYDLISTGYKHLDGVIKGLKKGALVVVGAETGAGKSAFALNIARHVAFEQKKRVDFFSLEMNRDEVFERLIALDAGCKKADINSVSQLATHGRSYRRIFEENKGRFIVQDSTELTVNAVKSRVLGVNEESVDRELGLIVVDYIQLLSSGERSSNRTDEVGSITRKLKQIAGSLNVPIIALSQLNRQQPSFNEDGTPERPTLSRLRESGSIEQDANQVIFLSRGKSNPSDVFVDVAKNRNGKKDLRVRFGFDGRSYRFAEQHKSLQEHDVRIEE